MDLRVFFEDLTSEQKSRFSACRSGSEIVAFAKEEKLALPDDFLAQVAGGVNQSLPEEFRVPKDMVLTCPCCGNTNQDQFLMNYNTTAVCLECAYDFNVWEDSTHVKFLD